MSTIMNVCIKRNDGQVGYSHMYKNEQGMIITNNYQGSYTEKEISNLERLDCETQKDKMYVFESTDVLSAFNEVLDFWYLPRIEEEPLIETLSPLAAYTSLFAGNAIYVVFVEPQKKELTSKTSTSP